MSELNRILNGNQIPFDMNTEDRQLESTYGRGVMGDYRRTIDFDILAQKQSGKVRPSNTLPPTSVPYGYTPAFYPWGQAKTGLPQGKYEPSYSGKNPVKIPPAVIGKSMSMRDPLEAVNGVIARNSYVRNVA